MKTRTSLIFAALLVAATGFVWAKDAPPETTPDGLKRVDGSTVDLLYVEPGADLAGYGRIYLLPPTVSFVHDYLKRQNSVRYNGERVTEQDMADMKKAVEQILVEEFTNVLQNDSGYVIVDGVAADVLAVRPAIMDLDIVSPEMKPNQRSAIPSVGSMTLYLELIDSVSGDTLAKALDNRIDRTRVNIHIRDSDRNEKATREMIRYWAGLLRDALDEARSSGS